MLLGLFGRQQGIVMIRIPRHADGTSRRAAHHVLPSSCVGNPALLVDGSPPMHHPCYVI